MNHFLSAPVTDAQRQRDALLGALVGLARSTVNEPKTEDTDRVLTSGLRLAQGRPDARAQEVIDQALFVLAEDWDEELLAPVVKRAEDCCAG